MKQSLMVRFSSGLILGTICLFAFAQTKVVVVPMGGDAMPMQNIVTVAKKNGDYTDPVEAMESISDADELFIRLKTPRQILEASIQESVGECSHLPF